MNTHHRDAIDIYARHYAGAEGEGWVLTGFDSDGMDLARGDEVRRVFFPEPLAAAQDLRLKLVEMAKAGRAAQSA